MFMFCSDVSVSTQLTEVSTMCSLLHTKFDYNNGHRSTLD